MPVPPFSLLRYRYLPTIIPKLSVLFLLTVAVMINLRLVNAEDHSSNLPGHGKKILVLCSYGYSLPSYQKLNRTLLAELKSGGVGTNDLFFEHLDLLHVQDEQQEQSVVDMLRAKYKNLGIDLVVTLHSPAIELLLDEAADIFPEIPIVTWDLQATPYEKDPTRRIFRAVSNYDVKGTLERALDLFPNTARVYILSGGSENDRLFETLARRDLANWEDKLQMEYLTDSVEEILKRVADLPPRSIVIYNRIYKDKTGRSFTPSEVGERVAKAANVPVFCLHDTSMDLEGMVGGSLLSFAAEGSRIGKIALDILSGKIAPGEETTAGKPVPMFDWQQINKWGGNANNLPEGTVFLHRPPTLWPTYAWHIIGVVVILLAQLTLIGALLVQRRQRTKAEEELRISNATLEQRVAERTAQLQKEKDRYYTLFNSMTEGFALHEMIYTADGKAADYRFLEINPAFERVTGLSREILGKTVREILPDTEDYWIETFARVALDGTPVYFENYSTSLNRWYEVYAYRTEPKEFAVFFTDITGRKLAEVALRKSESQLKRAQEIAHLGSWELDLTVNQLDWSDEVYRIFGLAPQEFPATYETFLEHVHPEDRAAVDEAYMGSIQAGRNSYEIEHRIVRSNTGEIHYVQEKCEHIRAEDGRIIRSAGTVLDVTERKKAQEALERSNKELEHQLRKIEELNRSLQATNILLEEKHLEVETTHKQLLHTEKLAAIGKLSASFAHEFNNPLQSIMTILKGIAQYADLKENEAELAALALQECRRMADLIANLQDFYRPTTGKIEPVNLHALFEDLMLMVKKNLSTRKILVVKEYAADLPAINAVTDQLKQVFLNLLNNAADACEGGGVITVTTESIGGERVAVHIKDNGVGIDTAVIGNIFEPFFTTKQHKGTGLGLSVSYGIIKKHGGDIEVKSEMGKGTVFSITLPIRGGSRLETGPSPAPPDIRQPGI